MAAEAASTNKLLDRLAAWVCVGLVLAISYVLVRILFFTLDPQVSAIAPTLYGNGGSAKGSVAMRTVAKPAVDPSAIPLWNLFGKEGVKKSAAPVKDVVAPTTRLKLILMGVFAHKEEERSTAIIAEQRKPGKLFHVGDKVPGNATLAAVYEDRVLLNTRGKLEALYFPQSNTAKKSSRAKSKRSRTSRSTRSSRSSRSSGRKKPSGISKMMRGGPSSPGQIASVIEEELGQNATGALRELGLEQNNGNGYKISSASNPLFSALGVKPGDVILSVNGMSIGDPEQDIKAIPEALEGSGGNCVINIQKADGRQFSQTFPCGGL